MMIRPALFLAGVAMPSAMVKAQSPGPVWQLLVKVARTVAKRDGTFPPGMIRTVQAARSKGIDLTADDDVIEHDLLGKAA